jgi:hypothetical protein
MLGIDHQQKLLDFGTATHGALLGVCHKISVAQGRELACNG